MASGRVDVLLLGAGSNAVQPVPVQVFTSVVALIPTILIGTRPTPVRVTAMSIVPFPSVNGSGTLYPGLGLFPATSLFPQN
jgi:hypothetical protein